MCYFRLLTEVCFYHSLFPSYIFNVEILFEEQLCIRQDGGKKRGRDRGREGGRKEGRKQARKGDGRKKKNIQQKQYVT